MLNKYFRSSILIATLLIGLGAAARAVELTPATSALNPVNETVYVIDNSSPQIKVYKKSGNDWAESPAQTNSLPPNSKCRGLAVSPNGDKLYVSLNAGANSKIRIYNISQNGELANDFADITGPYFTFENNSSPAGLALAGKMLFVADNNIGRILQFDLSQLPGDPFVKAITEQVAGKGDLHNIAAIKKVSGAPLYITSYRLYLSRKIGNGEIYVYNYNSWSGNVTYIKTITGLQWPTQLKIVGDKLYVAVNGANGEDIRVYSTTDESLIGTVKSGITGSFGWTTFDVSQDGNWLVYKKAANYTQTTNNLYKIETAAISGTKTAAPIPKAGNVIKSDGSALSISKYKVALAFSPDGSFAQYETGLGGGVPQLPEIPLGTNYKEHMKQYLTDGTTIIPKGGVTNQNYIIIKFWVTDANEDEITPRVYYRKLILGQEFPWVTFEGTAKKVSSDKNAPTEFQLTLPKSGRDPGNFPASAEDGDSYEWKVELIDPVLGSGNIHWPYNADMGSADFIVKDNAVISKDAPTIVATAPINDATDVNLGAPIQINFSESMSAESVKNSIQIVPALANLVFTWNTPETQVVISHPDFTLSTTYEITVGGTDLNQQALVASPAAPNKKFSFTTGTSGGNDPVVNLVIAREGDTPGSGIKITWETNPSGLGVDIYRLTCNTDASGNYTSYFTTETVNWGTPIDTDNKTGTFTVPSSVGTGTAQYYKLVKTGSSLTSNDLTTNVVGKFDIAATAALQYSMISIPLVQASTDFNDIIGNQLTGVALEFQSDKIFYPDGLGGFKASWLKNDGQWYDAGGSTPSTISVDITKCMYVYINAGAKHTDKNISIVGPINTNDAISTIAQGFNMIGTPYPLAVDLIQSGLFADGLKAGSFEYTASKLYSPNGSGGFNVAWLHNSGAWYDSGTSNPTSIKLTPGVGYYLNNADTQTLSFVWTYPKPY